MKARPLNLPGSATEDEFHISVARLLDVCLTPPTFYTTFPAGYGKLSKSMAGRLRAKGMMPGMPDILVFNIADRGNIRFYHTQVIGIELKVGGNSLSSSQRTAHAKLQGVGIRVYVARSLDEVIAALKDAGIQYRGIQVAA